MKKFKFIFSVFFLITFSNFAFATETTNKTNIKTTKNLNRCSKKILDDFFDNFKKCFEFKLNNWFPMFNKEEKKEILQEFLKQENLIQQKIIKSYLNGIETETVSIFNLTKKPLNQENEFKIELLIKKENNTLKEITLNFLEQSPNNLNKATVLNVLNIPKIEHKEEISSPLESGIINDTINEEYFNEIKTNFKFELETNNQFNMFSEVEKEEIWLKFLNQLNKNRENIKQSLENAEEKKYIKIFELTEKSFKVKRNFAITGYIKKENSKLNKPLFYCFEFFKNNKQLSYANLNEYKIKLNQPLLEFENSPSKELIMDDLSQELISKFNSQFLENIIAYSHNELISQEDENIMISIFKNVISSKDFLEKLKNCDVNSKIEIFSNFIAKEKSTNLNREFSVYVEREDLFEFNLKFKTILTEKKPTILTETEKTKEIPQKLKNIFLEKLNSQNNIILKEDEAEILEIFLNNINSKVFLENLTMSKFSQKICALPYYKTKKTNYEISVYVYKKAVNLNEFKYNIEINVEKPDDLNVDTFQINKLEQAFLNKLNSIEKISYIDKTAMLKMFLNKLASKEFLTNLKFAENNSEIEVFSVGLDKSTNYFVYVKYDIDSDYFDVILKNNSSFF